MNLLPRSLFLLRVFARIALLCLIAAPASAVTYSDNGDGTVTDLTTGLMWMRCSMGQTWTGSTCSGTAGTYSSMQASGLPSSLTFAGHNDWRLPEVTELRTIVDRSLFQPAIDIGAFPNTSASQTVMSGTRLQISANTFSVVWCVSFSNGSVQQCTTGTSLALVGEFPSYQVRLVRRQFSPVVASPAWVDHGDGTVTDQNTGLTWMVCPKGDGLVFDKQTNRSWCGGSGATYTWDQAVGLTDNFAGLTGWRLPTAKELDTVTGFLQSFTNYCCGVGMGSGYYVSTLGVSPGTVTAGFPTGIWSATSYVGDSSDGWTEAGIDLKTALHYVFLVIGSYDSANGPMALTVSKTGSGTVNAPTGINCGSTCTSKYGNGMPVTLTAAPAVNFIGWGGACSGTAATCTVTMNAAKDVTANFKDVPILSASPASLSFSNQNLGTTSAAQIVTLSNTGTASLNIASIVTSGDYAVTHICGTGLGISGFCNLNITFTPTTTGTRTGTVTITDDAFDSPQTVSLTGNGQGAVASPSVTTMTFASQGVGTTSMAQTITLTNTGGAALSIVSIAASGDFAQTNNCGASLAVGANCTISVTFTPTAVGSRTGSLMFGSPNAIALTGTGVAVPVVSLNPTSLAFAAQTVGTTSTAQTIALSNTGGATLSLSSITASGDFAQTDNCGAGLGGGGSCGISVTFTPTVAGTRSGTVTITSNAPGSPHTVSLTGPITISLDLAQGWNLFGNGIDQILTVASLFGDPLTVTTVWKWDTANLGWQFYAPSMDAVALQTYATSKGYGVLSVINAGEGFWVNAKLAFSKPLPSGTAVTAISFQDGQPGALKQGWNLIAIGDNKTPSQFNALVGAATPLTTLWAWDATLTNWYFYAPTLEAKGGTTLTDYITAKGYLDFTTANKMLGPGVGFWVNKQ